MQVLTKTRPRPSSTTTTITIIESSRYAALERFEEIARSVADIEAARVIRSTGLERIKIGDGLVIVFKSEN